MSEEESPWKGGYDKASWIGRYMEAMFSIGYNAYEAECAALNAWEASPEDADPDDTANDDISYMREDGHD